MWQMPDYQSFLAITTIKQRNTTKVKKPFPVNIIHSKVHPSATFSKETSIITNFDYSKNYNI